jgi:hypothetical protein
MLHNKKNVFWEALILTIAVFVIGWMIGVSFEKNKVEEINKYYSESDAVLMDVLALQKITELGVSNCTLVSEANIEFANRVYDEAVLMEKYEVSQKISEGMALAHKKYDLLRTFLWINSMKSRETCGNDFSVVVYLYEYNTDDLAQKAVQSVWSKVISDLKQEKGDSIILIPIAVDTNVTSLDLLIDKFNIQKFPAIIINDKEVIYDLKTPSDLETYLD